jgi:cytidylate kinase
MKIAIHGPMCSGKTTIANMIIRMDPRYQRFSYGQKIKDLASELFDMKEKDRTLLINIADSMREINPDVWVNYIMKQTKNREHCVIDDLRFQNELDSLSGWKIISLKIPRDERIRRIKQLYPNDVNNHIQNMEHASETGVLRLPDDTIYIDTTKPMKVIEQQLFVFLEKNK